MSFEGFMATMLVTFSIIYLIIFIFQILATIEIARSRSNVVVKILLLLVIWLLSLLGLLIYAVARDSIKGVRKR